MKPRYASNRALHKIEARYPRLLSLMRFVGCLSNTEASACIRDYVDGFEYSSEAVHHYGGAPKLIKRAVELRTNYGIRKMLKA